MFVAGGGILMAVITAEALYPARYTTHLNEISDLGATRPPNSVILQPSATIFDLAMVGAGILVVVAAVLLFLATRNRTCSIPLALLGFGVLGVGLFPGNTFPHPYFALLAFTAGGAAAILAWGLVSRPMRYLSALLGAVTLVSLVLAEVPLDWGPVASLGAGGIERWIAYPVVLWLAGFGGFLLADRTPNLEVRPGFGGTDDT
ncbi:MAG: DUF998 domain-containing protein [Candidatus Dormibacteraeota bacterium]|nr:DUF998 domain-containing protein [Candidatus Dormibacteraeota bacterium]